ncbi:MAG: efflux RND transporter periplasmic adaptor subunit [Sedimentisphaerales bacterium]|nr:efflux RND transporter periplasmic adaptor subunit [Sedimentisphaerales bacterium]
MESEERKKKVILTIPKLLLAVVLAFAGGFVISRITSTSQQAETQQQKVRFWTCSMHPQIHQPKPGKCPICFMDLIPVETNGNATALGPRQISFSPEAVKLMEVQTSKVERKFVEAEVRMVGKIEYDETRLKHVAAWVGGRIEKLYVDFTGTEVIKGDHMVELYSPELISAQAEYLQTLRSVENMPESTSELVKKSSEDTLKAAKEKLLLLGLTERQLQDIKSKDQPTDYLTIYAPAGGIVIERHVTEGQYVKTGTMIYTIADLSDVWVKLDAYESDMQQIRYGQKVKFTTEAYPGEVFTGTITFISPILDAKTRTVKLRVNVPNPDGRLKPDMFVSAVLKAKIAESGVLADMALAGKWICPMHPSVIKDSKGTCDICGMDLVTVESRGLVKEGETENPPLVIPASAPLITGKRAVVYVKLPDPNRPIFEGREVVLGPRAGDYYIVKEGLSEGEIVVTNGSFKIDSALQIQAKPSMMSPQGSEMSGMHMHHKQ